MYMTIILKSSFKIVKISNFSHVQYFCTLYAQKRKEKKKRLINMCNFHVLMKLSENKIQNSVRFIVYYLHIFLFTHLNI